MGCKNTCLEKSAADRQVVRDRVAKFQRALDMKAELSRKAKETQAAWASRVGVVGSELAQQEAEVRRLEGKQLGAEGSGHTAGQGPRGDGR